MASLIKRERNPLARVMCTVETELNLKIHFPTAGGLFLRRASEDYQLESSGHTKKVNGINCIKGNSGVQREVTEYEKGLNLLDLN